MAIQISGNTVIDDSRNYLQVASVSFSDGTTQTTSPPADPIAGPIVNNKVAPNGNYGAVTPSGFETYKPIVEFAPQWIRSGGSLDPGSLGCAVEITQNYLVALETLSSNNTNKLFVFDLNTNKLLWQTERPFSYETSFGKNKGSGDTNTGGPRPLAANDKYVVVGAPESPSNRTTGNSIGRVYVYDIKTGALLKIYNGKEDPNAGDGVFGNKLDLSGTYVIIGEHGRDYPTNADDNQGRVYIYDIAEQTTDYGSMSTPQYEIGEYGGLLHIIDNPNAYANTASFDRFGSGVAIDGNLCVIGASGEDDVYANGSIASSAGKVYVFNVDDGSIVATISNPGLLTGAIFPNRGNTFGNQVGIKGRKIIVGEPNADGTVGSLRGAIHYFDLDHVGYHKWTVSGNDDSDMIGDRIKITDDYIISGEWNGDKTVSGYPPTGNLFNADDSGRVRIFDHDGNLIGGIDNPEPANSNADYFGISVSVYGNRIAVGHPYGNRYSGQTGLEYTPNFAEGWEGNSSSGYEGRISIHALDNIVKAKNYQNIEFDDGTSANSLKELLGNYERPADWWKKLSWSGGVSSEYPSPVNYSFIDAFQISGIYQDFEANSEMEVAVWNDIVVMSYRATKGVGAGPTTVGAGSRHGGVWICDLYSGDVLHYIEDPRQTETDNQTAHFFGHRIAINDKWLIITAPTTTHSYPFNLGKGKAYVYSVGDWRLVGYLEPDPALLSEYSYFGIGGLDICGDLVAIGDADDNSNDSDTPGGGRVYLFDLKKLYWHQGTPYDRIAEHSVKAYTHVAYFDNPDYLDSAADDDSSFVNDNFGYELALSGNYLAVSSVANVDAETAPDYNTGVVYVFDTTVAINNRGFTGTTDPSLLYKLSNQGEASTNNYFGHQIDIDQGKLIVADTDPSFNGVGRVCLYDIYDGSLIKEMKSSEEYNTYSSGFGYSLSASNGWVAIGEPNSDQFGTNEGRVYLVKIDNKDYGNTVGPNGQTAIVSGPSLVDQTTRRFGHRVFLHNGNLAVVSKEEVNTDSGDSSEECSRITYLFPSQQGTIQKTHLDRLVEMVD